jgi:hypothetical protein
MADAQEHNQIGAESVSRKAIRRMDARADAIRHRLETIKLPQAFKTDFDAIGHARWPTAPSTGRFSPQLPGRQRPVAGHPFIRRVPSLLSRLPQR